MPRRGRCALLGGACSRLLWRKFVDKRLLEILVCPLCKGPLTHVRADQELICTVDKLAYPIRDGIPALLAASRLPHKALADIGGLPMVVRVAMQARASGAARVLIAADAQCICD